MRTLKKTLCLVLVVVMMAGLCSIGTSAAFADADKINYTQAADVLNALGVMKGDENGFRPQDTITRAEACVMIVRMLGAEGAKATATSFTDLAGYGWAKDAIAYCEAEGIVAGNGDGTFNPGGKLTGYAFAKMLFCAAGYNDEAEGLVGANWEIGVAKLVKTERIAKRIAGFDGTAACTREEAAELAFQAGTEVATRTFKEGTKVEGAGISVTMNGEYTDIYDPMFVRFLDLEDVGGDPTNDLGQPITNYECKGGKVKFSVVKKPVVTFTAATKAKAVATALKGYTYDDAKINADNADIIALAELTGNGTLVEVYADEDKNITDADVNVIEYETFKVSDVKPDKKTGNVTYTIDSQDYTDDAEDDTKDEIVFKTAPAKGDVITAVVVDPGAKIYVYATTKVTGTLTALTSDGNTATIDGTKYTKGEYFTGNALATATKAANYYLDQYGYVVYTDSTAASTDYAYIVSALGEATDSIDGTSYKITVRAVLADGTVGTYTLALRKSGTNSYIKGLTDATKLDSKDGDTALDSDTVKAFAADLATQVFGYTLADGVMTLEELVTGNTYAKSAVVTGDTDSDVAAKATSAAINSDSSIVLFNSATKVIAYNSDTKTATVFNGTSALPASFSEVLTYVGKANADNGSITASLAFVEAAIAGDAGTDLVYIDTDKYVESKVNGKTVYTYTGTYANGETIELTGKAADGKNAKLTANKDGLYTFAGTDVKDSFNKCIDTNTTVTKDKFVYVADLTTTSDMIEYVEDAYAEVTDATQIVYIKEGVTELKGAKGFVVLDYANGALTGKVAQIFVVG